MAAFDTSNEGCIVWSSVKEVKHLVEEDSKLERPTIYDAGHWWFCR